MIRSPEHDLLETEVVEVLELSRLSSCLRLASLYTYWPMFGLSKDGIIQA